jgi:hypothetical protein
MAPMTYLQRVTEQEIAALRADPASIMRLDNPSHFTHYACSINYFVSGDAYPDPDENEFGGLIYGDPVDCAQLENGNFDVITPAQVAALAPRLKGIDVTAIAKAVGEADFDALIEEEELYDLELFEEDDDPGSMIADEVKDLIAFYRETAALGLGLVTYTT